MDNKPNIELFEVEVEEGPQVQYAVVMPPRQFGTCYTFENIAAKIEFERKVVNMVEALGYRVTKINDPDKYFL